MTTKRASTIIENAKRSIPSWPTIDWSMVYAEIDEEEIWVCPLVDGDLTRGKPFQFSGDALDEEIAGYIEEIRASLRLSRGS